MLSAHQQFLHIFGFRTANSVKMSQHNLGSQVALVAEWLRVRLRVRMVKGSTLTVGNFLSLENLNVIIRAIN